MDFVFDRTAEGWLIQCLTGVDDAKRASPARPIALVWSPRRNKKSPESSGLFIDFPLQFEGSIR